MSFIRCLSNPESLYVYHNVYGFIDWIMTLPKGERFQMNIPPRTFYGLIRKYVQEYFTLPVKWGKMSVDEVWTSQKTGKVLGALNDEEPRIEGEADLKVRVRYKDQECVLWDVTWDMVVQGVVHTLELCMWKRKKGDDDADV